jgi:anti-sigma factor RsiW
MSEPDAKLETKNKCAGVRDQLALLLYGELSFDEEEIVETHLDTCAECRGALDRQRELHVAFDRFEVEPPPSLLRECRAALGTQLASSPVVAPQSGDMPSNRWWDKLVHLVTGRGPSGFRGAAAWLRPAGALTLLAIGFAIARIAPVISTGSNGVGMMGLADMSAAHVRNVEPGSDGRVTILVDETQQKVISGGLEDRQIRSMLLAAARDSTDPGVRAATVELLTSDAASADVRDVLISALRHDQNAGVRLKALEGLKQFAKDPAVRRTFAQVLLSDGNPGVRTQAIDLLTQSAGSAVDQDLVGPLQELMMKEQNPYVRERCQSVLASWNASSEIY